VAEVSGILARDALSLGKQFPVFWHVTLYRWASSFRSFEEI
jgi:hypothetical protein